MFDGLSYSNNGLNDHGLLPNTPEEIAEINRCTVDFDKFSNGSWQYEDWALGEFPQDRYTVPPNISWSSFKPELELRKQYFDKLRAAGWCLWWWEIARAYGVDMSKALWWSQGSYGSCAGFSAAAAYYRKVIYQMLTAPWKYEQINPMPTWAIGKNYSTRGGASMAGVKIGVAKYGNYAADDAGIGPYPGSVNRTVYEKVAARAQERQLCSCDIPATVEAVKLCLDACETVAIGNRNACRSASVNSLGIKEGRMGGSWSHAHNLDAIRYVKGIPWYHWSNSHGPIYKGSKENCPDIGCWLSESSLKTLISGAQMWCSVYAEAHTDGYEKGLYIPKPVYFPEYITVRE